MRIRIVSRLAEHFASPTGNDAGLFFLPDIFQNKSAFRSRAIGYISHALLPSDVFIAYSSLFLSPGSNIYFFNANTSLLTSWMAVGAYFPVSHCRAFLSETLRKTWCSKNVNTEVEDCLCFNFTASLNLLLHIIAAYFPEKEESKIVPCGFFRLREHVTTVRN